MCLFDLHALAISGSYAIGLWRAVRASVDDVSDSDPALLTFRCGRQVSVMRHEADTVGVYAPGPESVMAFLDWLSVSAPNAVAQIRAVGIWPQSSPNHPFQRVG